ncbi:MAG: hypothetical protein M3173_07915, partial [Chloroflexota bacterium]|nr:hypothetical protein [Chloroflexota bacterium]
MVERNPISSLHTRVDQQELGIIVVAPYPSVRAGLSAMVERQPGVVVLAEWAADPLDTLTVPDVLVIDLDPGRLTLP